MAPLVEPVARCRDGPTAKCRRNHNQGGRKGWPKHPNRPDHNLNEQDIEIMTGSHFITAPLFFVVFIPLCRIIGGIRDRMEARQARREKYAADFAEMRADLAEVKASAQTTL